MENDDATAEGAQLNSAATRKPLPTRTKALIGILLFICVTFGVNAAHVYALEYELREIAAQKERLELERADRLGIDIETGFIVTASKTYLIYGDVQGKIEVFIRRGGPDSRIVGMDYFLARDGNEWTVFESGTCTDEMCQIRGTKALAE